MQPPGSELCQKHEWVEEQIVPQLYLQLRTQPDTHLRPKFVGSIEDDQIKPYPDSWPTEILR